MFPDPPIEEERIRRLNERPVRDGAYVLYWMQQAQRARHNDALDYAVAAANERGQGVAVVFGLTDRYPEANLRHYAFLCDGLRDVAAHLESRRIPFAVLRGAPPGAALRAAADASLIVCDRGYLRHQRAWRRAVAREAPCAVVEVETDAVVPVETVSNKAEYAARTIRPRIRRHLDRFLALRRAPPLRHPLRSAPRALAEGATALDTLPAALALDRSVPPVGGRLPGGTRAALRRLEDFLARGLANYAAHRNRPETDDVSGMAMFLHFGQLSPVELACRVRDADAPAEAKESFLEELCVRRELSNNFTNYTEDYDRYEEAVPEWARATLAKHARDERPHGYARAQLEAAETYDPYWNAAMRDMRCTGYLHNYLRMYWGKKILEWSADPAEAFETALALNNRYFLDGRDPSSYAGVAWVFGRHDRPWGDRAIYGTVRCLTAAGLERKCDIRAYVQRSDQRFAAGARAGA